MTELSQEHSEIQEKGVLGEAAIKESPDLEGAKKLKVLKDKEGPVKELGPYESTKPIEELIGRERLEKMGYRRDVDGRKRRIGAEGKRFKLASERSALIERYLKEGLGEIPEEEIKDIISDYDRALVVWPEGAMVEESDREAYIKRRLEDPRFAGIVREAYKGSLDSTDSFDESVVDAEGKLRTVETEKDAAIKRYGANERERTTVGARVSLFERDASGDPKAKLKELEDIRTKVVEDEPRGNVLKKEIDGLNRRLALKINLADNPRGMTALGTDPATVGLEVVALQGEIDTRQGELDSMSQDISKKDQLEEEMHALESDKKRLEEEEVNLKRSLDEAEHKLSTSRAFFEDARNTRGTQEERFVSDLKNVFLNSALKDVEGTIDEWETRRSGRNKELEEKTGDRAAKVILRSDRRWVESTGTRPKDIKIKKNQIEDDYFLLLNDGAESLIRKILSSEMENGERVFSDAEIEEKLADENFMKQVQPELVSQLLFRRINVKKLGKKEVEIIATSKWGEGMFEAAFAKDDKVGKAIDKLKEMGRFSGSRMDFLKSMAKNPKSYGALAAIIALLLGSPFIAAGGLAATGVYSAGVGAIY